MSLRPLLTSALRTASRPAARTLDPKSAFAAPAAASGRRLMSANAHAQESFEDFTARYVAFFNGVEDLFELQRGLNNCFAHDLVPAPGIIEAALRASRRVDDYATAVRIFEGVREKTENKQQYEAYLAELKGVKEELGVETKEEMYAGHA
ncbi:COX5A-domain-containing protein [Auricularia subglabra TFB-10046 SS5]|nr:COX5A-domain-containing protein [Auricularia subglabra TFB-10046 SS5]